MIVLDNSDLVINIKGDTHFVVSSFLKVFLANQRLTAKQLEVTTSLVSKYTVYHSQGVIEPYASQLLFSSETRKEICQGLGITAPHLNNTFNALCKKNILAKQSSKYVINPDMIPNSTLKFNFEINDKPRQIGDRSSQTNGIDPEAGKGDTQ